MAEYHKMVDKTPEEAGIAFKEAEASDLNSIERFLSRPEIDSLFVTFLSDPARGISMRERVEKKFKQGVWMIAQYGGEVVGCMAVVPSSLPLDVPGPNPAEGINLSEGVSLRGWEVERIMELSTVVTDKSLKEKLEIKGGVGEKLLKMSEDWVITQGKGKWGLITDSWLGGSDMEIFITKMNTKAYLAWAGGQEPSILQSGKGELLSFLVRIYSDPKKRGPEGPPTVVYAIPLYEQDWRFFLGKIDEIARLKEIYKKLAQLF